MEKHKDLALIICHARIKNTHMFSQKTAIILLLTVLIAGQTLAQEINKIEIDSSGTIYHFWLSTSSFEGHTPSSIEGIVSGTPEGVSLEFAKSIDQGNTFSQPQRLLNFANAVTFFDIQAENGKFFLAYVSEDFLHQTSLIEDGRILSPPSIIAFDAQSPTLAINNNLVLLAWEEQEIIYVIQSEDYGNSFNLPRVFQITGEALSFPRLVIDNLNNPHLAFFSQNKALGINQIVYTHITSPEPIIISESYDDLVNLQIEILPIGLAVTWQKEYFERREAYIATSLDWGVNFSNAKLFDFENTSTEFHILNNELFSIGFDEKPRLTQVYFPLLPAPQVIQPLKDTVISSANLELSYRIQGRDPLLAKIDLSAQEDFFGGTTWKFDQVISPITQEAIDFAFPVYLSDGNYFIRIHTLDGLSTSSHSEIIRVEIDNTSPQITTLETERIDSNYFFSGETDEPLAWMAINGTLVTLESDNHFACQFPLEQGINYFTFILTDEAGNQTIATEETFYDPTLPQITVLNPKISDWFRNDSTIIIEAAVKDLQNDVLNETEARIKINDLLLEDTLTYDAEDGTLFGFIYLPEDMADGNHSGSIILRDLLGNEGVGNFSLNIDASPPQVIQTQNKTCFSNSQSTFSILVSDDGAGIDAAGTIINIPGISFEGTVSAESQEISVTINSLLPEGTYEVEVTPRDMIGNIGDTAALYLVIDQTPPLLTLTGSYESETKEREIMIQAEINEAYPSSIKIYNNQQLSASFVPNGLYFSKSINLFPGSNDILVEAWDQAGNKTCQNLHVFADISANSILISNYANGPNPFSPTSDGLMYFIYTLASTSDLKLYIFDLAGNLIWKKEVQNATSGNTSWNGIDHYGKQVSNGIYPYLIHASSATSQEIKRGKIIVLK